MIYPIIPYGQPVLRKQAQAIPYGTDVKQLVADMFATMDSANGVGLAAPQIGKSIQLFVVDITSFMDPGAESKQGRQAYINPVVTFPTHNSIVYEEEGCLSIPQLYGRIPRHKAIQIKFFDDAWNPQEENLEDFPARVVQHEYDHLLGKLHIDYLLSTIKGDKRHSLEAQLRSIQKGDVEVNYPMLFRQRAIAKNR
jgi:peptide deformylase